MKFPLDHDAPEDLSYLSEYLGHDVMPLHKVLATDASDEGVLRLAPATETIFSTWQPASITSDHSRDPAPDASG